MNIKLIIPFFLFWYLCGSTFAQGPTEADKIQYLIASVETLKDAVFIRNGAEHEPKEAADHLRLKLRRAGSRVKTTEDFIRLCASKSSLSGQAYQIRFRNGSVVETGVFLRDTLKFFHN